ncbi:MAG: hypothetical protein ACTSRG_17235 [Candidatus Helarchaeota archaeon]
MSSLQDKLKNLEKEKKNLIDKFKKLEKDKESLSKDDYNLQRNNIERALVEIMDRLVQYRKIMNGGQ